MASVFDGGAHGMDMRASFAERVRARVLGLIDSAIAPEIRCRQDDLLRRYRIVSGFAWVLVLVGLETSVFFHWALSSDATQRIDLALVAALGTTYVSIVGLRRGWPVLHVSNLLLLGAFLVTAASFSVVGGIRAPLLHWCGLIPMLAVLMGGRRSALWWVGANGLLFGGRIWMDVQGIYAGRVLDEHLTGSTLWAQRFMDVGSWTIMLLSVMFVYESLREAQAEQLSAQNEQLAREARERERAEQRTWHLAYYDELTKLPNRSMFKQNLEQAMERADREGRTLAIMFLDLDGFKEVNDAHGHDFGDELLQQVAERLTHCVRRSDQVARTAREELNDLQGAGSDAERETAVSRLGGDEFTILLDALRDPSEAALVARRVLHALSNPIILNEQEIFISASIGVALYPGPAETLDQLLRCADLAMYHAKAVGKNNFQYYESSLNEELLRRAALVRELRRAIPDGQFVLHYQPLVESVTQSIVGVEALIRWRHPERGLLAPFEFIEVAEASGLIAPMGEWIVEEVCHQIHEWRRAGYPRVRVAMNVSAAQLRGDSLPAALSRQLSSYGVDAKCIELEITENAILVDEQEALRCLKRLKRLGVSIVLDDFGTGFSSLSYLMRFPVDSLKVDRSFVAGVTHDRDAQAITAAIIAMAHQLGLKVVGEGVETVGHRDFLVDCGCHELQGFLYSPGLPAEDVTDLLAAGRIEVTKPDED
ncbi:MAG: EAL domain-containing protein [Proteobacteria bacterium]|nr:EAL domain-containing protein [Pseudomonadota bacterium]